MGSDIRWHVEPVGVVGAIFLAGKLEDVRAGGIKALIKGGAAGVKRIGNAKANGTEVFDENLASSPCSVDSGAPGRNRTVNPLFTKQPLYQLSYEGEGRGAHPPVFIARRIQA